MAGLLGQSVCVGCFESVAWLRTAALDTLHSQSPAATRQEFSWISENPGLGPRLCVLDRRSRQIASAICPNPRCRQLLLLLACFRLLSCFRPIAIRRETTGRCSIRRWRAV